MSPPAGEVLTLSDDLLAAILILLPALADLGRACAACSAFRRVITSTPFLRRLHALHPPALLGFRTFYGGFQPVEPSHPSAAAARALARAADFRLSFLPNPGFWVVRDARGGRFLVDYDESGDGMFTKLAVCDPLFRRYVLLPPIPKDLTAAVQQHITTGFRISRLPRNRRSHVLLAPCGEEAAAADAEQPQPFRVVWMTECATKLCSFVFYSASSQWRATACPSWHDLDPKMPALIRHHHECLLPGGYAYGCFYWCLTKFLPIFKLLVLDMSTLEFSINPTSVPACRFFTEFAVVELGESRRAMILLGQSGRGTLLQCYCANGQSHAEDASQWVLEIENEVPLFGDADGTCMRTHNMIGDADGTLLLQERRENSIFSDDFCCISFDFKTLQLQKVRETLAGGMGDRALPALYTGYPPSLSSPTI
ncbi:unnamed protein product [Urochloa decumbens]|uniref:F-box domain-containing protein n=1 Tax=Urochloa decumbens TaxID=240449 RepID=A0ABC9F2T9_9POAL